VSADEYKLKSRRVQCAACGDEHWFGQTKDNLTHWVSQKAGCDAWFGQEGFDTEPIGPAAEYDWLKDEAPQPSWRDLNPPETALVEAEPRVPARINLAPVLDLTLPIADRTQSLKGLLTLAAAEMVGRYAEDDPDAYADQEFTRQAIIKHTLKEITDLRRMVNTLEVQWALEHSDEEWLDADGQPVDPQEVIESMMPDEEQRKSSGRARQVANFAKSRDAFRKAGFSDRHIAECGRSGMSSVLGIVSSNQLKLAEAGLEPEDLQERYGRLIDAAAEATTLQGLKKVVKGILDPDYKPPPTIRYSLENDGDQAWWFLAKPTHEQFTELILGKLGDVLELDQQLPEWFARFWNSFSVPAGQG